MTYDKKQLILLHLDLCSLTVEELSIFLKILDVFFDLLETNEEFLRSKYARKNIFMFFPLFPLKIPCFLTSSEGSGLNKF